MAKLVKLMTSSFIEQLPADLVMHVRSGCGERGVDWLNGLDEDIRVLEDRWSISVGPAFPAGEYNFVAPAVKNNGDETVIKIAPPWGPVEIHGEAEYLRHRAGNGCVRLLNEEAALRAILIERIRPGKNLVEEFRGREMGMLGPAIDCLRSVTRPVPEPVGAIQSLDTWFDGLRGYSSTAFPAGYAEKALSIYDRLSFLSPRLYLHGDYHPGNVVTSPNNGFCVIDPKGLIGNIGYDIGVFLNNFHWMQESGSDLDERLGAAIAAFSRAFNVSDQELREWAFAQMVIGAWWNFVDMPDLYDGSVVKADVWNV